MKGNAEKNNKLKLSRPHRECRKTKESIANEQCREMRFEQETPSVAMQPC